MNNSIISKITKTTKSNIENTVSFYEKLKNNLYVKDSFKDIRIYLEALFETDNLKMVLNDDSNLENELIYEYSMDKLDDKMQFQTEFKVRVNNQLEITYSFVAKDQEHYDLVNFKYDDLSDLFNLISPILYFTYLKEIIEELKVTDNVTLLYNRVYLNQHLEKMIPLARRENKKVAFLMVGIDHFKAVIDEFDYEIGDMVLQELAKVLKDTIRTSDIVVRLEGDEFLIVLHNVISEENASMVAQKLIDIFKEIKVLVNPATNQTLKKTICVGVSLYPDDSATVDQVLKNADVALYEARNKGRNQSLLFSKTQADVVELF